MKRRSLIFALGMVVLLVVFWIGGDNAVVYVFSLLGVPIVSGGARRPALDPFLACCSSVPGCGGRPRPVCRSTSDRFITTTGTHQGLVAIGFARTDCFPPDGADTLDRVRSPRVSPQRYRGRASAPRWLARSSAACLERGWDSTVLIEFEQAAGDLCIAVSCIDESRASVSGAVKPED
jgi:hypothetical protein